MAAQLRDKDTSEGNIAFDRDDVQETSATDISAPSSNEEARMSEKRTNPKSPSERSENGPEVPRDIDPRSDPLRTMYAGTRLRARK